jgi:uncharacterized protein (DUF362 family)
MTPGLVSAFRMPSFDPRPEAAEAAVAGVLRLAGLDRAAGGTPEWNPLGAYLRPGQTVLLKPNWVKAAHPREAEGAPWEPIVTSTAVLRAVARFALRAVGPGGRVIAADAPQTDSSFALLDERLGLGALEREFQQAGHNFQILDLRKEEWTARDGVIAERRALAGDPAGYVAFDLGAQSEFAGHDGAGRYYGADYDAGELNRHHCGGRHEYLLARTAIEASAVISLPKLKTHKKTGITAGLKNLVGVNGDKNWLPHHTEWGILGRGDERPRPTVKSRAERWGASALRTASQRIPALESLHRALRRGATGVFGDTERVIRSGNWHGNDTCWRMCLDLNKLILYGNPDGTLRAPEESQRRTYLVLADGILAGQGSGPMNPDPVEAGLLLFGADPAAVDAAAAVLMGFDPDQIPVVERAFAARGFPVAHPALHAWRDTRLVSNEAAWNGALDELDPARAFRFEPHFGWRGKIERRTRASAPAIWGQTA